MIEPELKHLGVPEDRLDPLGVLRFRFVVQLKDFGRAPDHRERSANLVHDSGQQPADLDKLLVQHGHAGHLAKLNQPAHATKHDGAGGSLAT